jgi:sterol desaturase/sphingolipid hydroxylase (fatty acid hydroxylase superfamily)
VPLYLQYYFWLILISLSVGLLERCWPRAPGQRVLRPEWDQDLFWLLFNSYFVSWMLAVAGVHLAGWVNTSFLHLGWFQPDTLRLLAAWPGLAQFVVCFVVKDFIEYQVHRMLHAVPWLWRFHQLHHSSEQLDWLAAFRGHWVEIVIHKLVAYVPLVILGVDDRVIFAVVALQTLLHELTHANLPWSWGPLGYVFNSPRLHAWHHDVALHGRHGQNFSISLSLWDWLFGTAYLPADRVAPARLGFDTLETYPQGIWARLWAPLRPSRADPKKPPAAPPASGGPNLPA